MARASLSLFGILLVGFAVRCLALWPASHVTLLLDERTYTLRAEYLLDGKGFTGSFQSWVRHPDLYPGDMPQYPGALQPPGYTAFIAGAMALAGRSLTAVRFAQVVLSTATIALVFALGRAWFDRRSGIAAAWICALYPDLIAYSHYFWSETLYIFLLLAGLWLLARGGAPPGRGAAGLAGLTLGAAALTRSALVYFLPVLVAWLAVSRRGHWRPALARGALVAGVALATIAPWTLRNQGVHGGFVLIDTNGPYNLWRGNAPGAYALRDDPSVPRYAWPFESIPMVPVGEASGHALIQEIARETGNTHPTDLEVIEHAGRVAWQQIAGDPAGFVARARYKLIDMWNPTSFLVRHLELKAYGDLPFPVVALLRFVSFATYLALLVLAAAGLWLARRNPGSWLIVAFTGFFTGISVLAFGFTRFRLPLIPFYCMLAGHALCALADRRRMALHAR